MSPRPSEQLPFPEHTPPPKPPPPRARRKRAPAPAHPSDFDWTLRPRQQLADQQGVANGQSQCQNTGNTQLSCFPTSGTKFNQHDWASFVWNSRTPYFTNSQTAAVNIYLHQADTRQIIKTWMNQPSQQDQPGLVSAQVDDTWWPGKRGSMWNGTDIPFEYYFIVTASNLKLDGSEPPQATFTAVQTTFADSVLASMSSTSSASSASSVSSSRSASSASSVSSASSKSAAASASASAGLNGSSASSSFPHWAIAVIVVLGFLALLCCCILAFLLMRRYRSRNGSSHRGSMGSASPMMANAAGQHQDPNLPLLGGAAAGAAAAGEKGEEKGDGERVASDGASVTSRTHSMGEGLFSGADAAIMADAFRTALRKPDFAGRPVEEGESPGSAADRAEQARLQTELAEEGRDIRSVASSRGVTVEGAETEEGGVDQETVQDH